MSNHYLVPRCKVVCKLTGTESDVAWQVGVSFLSNTVSLVGKEKSQPTAPLRCARPVITGTCIVLIPLYRTMCSIANFQEKQGNWSEVAMCILHAAAIVNDHIVVGPTNQPVVQGQS